MPTGAPDGVGPLFTASLDLLARMGAREVQVRYDEEQDPVVWVVVAKFRDGFEAAGAMVPELAAFRLCDRLADGGVCAHCRRPSGVTEEWRQEMPAADVVCWYVFDPETEKFRRSCEGDAKVERNAPCPCGSGVKFKRCHGRS